MNYLIDLEPELRAAERERRLAYARLCAEARLPDRGHPVLARTGQLLTRAGSWLEAWAEPHAARPTWSVPGDRVSTSKKAVTPC